MHRPWRRLCSMPSSRRREWEVRSRRLPPIGAGDAHPLLVLSGTEPELGGGKKPIDDDVIATHAVVHEFGGIALRTNNEKRGKLALADAFGECDEDMAAVFKSVTRHPGRTEERRVGKGGVSTCRTRWA